MDINIIYEQRHDRYYKSYNSSLQNFFILGGDGSVIGFFNEPCYSKLREDIEFFTDDNVLITYLSVHDKWYYANTTTKKLVLKYISWIVNKSPWRFAFITKNAKDIFDNGAVVDLKYKSEYIISALSALRNVNEGHNLINTWEKFISIGVDKHTSQILSTFLQYDKTLDYFSYSHSDDHSELPSSKDCNVARNFKDYKPLVKHNKRMWNGYTKIGHFWYEHNKVEKNFEEINQCMRNKISKITVRDGFGNKYTLLVLERKDIESYIDIMYNYTGEE